MINKEEQEAIKELTEIKELVEEDLKYDDYNATAILDQTDLKSLVIVLNLIKKQENRIKELEKINEEHQKLNGELQKKLTEYEKQLDLDYVEENYVKKSVFLNLLKENGELKDRLIIAEEICKGKSIQELGMSDLYKEKKDD